MTRLTRLDGLRALAVTAVIWQHWGPPAALEIISPGHLGVRLFFVLSGFLITGILLDTRDTAPVSTVMRVFYLRRALRIFPAYYLALLFGALVAEDVRRDWPWHVTYLSNLKLALDQRWSGYAQHLWSLAVEEQFYLIWPTLILFVPKRHLPKMMLGLVAAAPLFRELLLEGFNNNMFAARYSLLGCLDALSIGAWLAWHRRRTDAPLSRWCAILGGLILGGNFLAEYFDTAWRLRIAVASLGSALLFLAVIDHVRAKGRYTAWLSWPPLVYIGTISYGIYLLHNFVAAGLGMVNSTMSEWLLQRGLGPFALVTAVTIALATLSWFAVERPLNSLKRRLPYASLRKRRTRETVAFSN